MTDCRRKPATPGPWADRGDHPVEVGGWNIPTIGNCGSSWSACLRWDVNGPNAAEEREVPGAPCLCGRLVPTGEALAQSGERDAAVDAYQRALAIRPDFKAKRGSVWQGLFRRWSPGRRWPWIPF